MFDAIVEIDWRDAVRVIDGVEYVGPLTGEERR